ncbi:PAC2 family protein [Chloroflexota bacterium]
MMLDAVDLWEKPEAEKIYMLAGWRQWADAGSISSGLPRYMIQQLGAKQIGQIRPDGFYLFQFPGTHDLVRPVVRFEAGFPRALETQRNEIYYAGDEKQGVVIFLGDEPHMDVERYVTSILDMAQTLGVRRIIGFGGVYGELPYDRERTVSSIYSLSHIKDELDQLAVNLSDYQGGASIGSYTCRRAGEREMEYVSFYSFVPLYDLSGIPQVGNSIRIENDFMAWLGVMQRVNHMLKLGFDLSDLQEKSQKLVRSVDAKVEELDKMTPQSGVSEYLKKLAEDFTEISFDPLDDIWQEEINRLFDKLDENDEPETEG